MYKTRFNGVFTITRIEVTQYSPPYSTGTQTNNYNLNQETNFTLDDDKQVNIHYVRKLDKDFYDLWTNRFHDLERISSKWVIKLLDTD